MFMFPSNHTSRLTAIAIWFLMMAGVLGGCNFSLSAGSAESITQDECEADSAFAFVPGGEFILGSDLAEKDFAYLISAQSVAKTKAEIERAEQNLRQTGWFEREESRQTSSLSGFCIGRNLVTNQEYLEFVLATDRQLPGITETAYQKQGFLVHPYSKVREFLWSDSTFPPNTEKHPVVLISYQDAVAYAQWKGKQMNENYRLPTAKEWEKAARGKDGKYFPWGNEWLATGTNAAVSKLNYTSQVASFPLSESVYGIEDMAGNVFEYTSTLKFAGSRVLMKGCSWDDLPGFCRGAYSHTRPTNSRHILFGFRLVKE